MILCLFSYMANSIFQTVGEVFLLLMDDHRDEEDLEEVTDELEESVVWGLMNQKLHNKLRILTV